MFSEKDVESDLCGGSPGILDPVWSETLAHKKGPEGPFDLELILSYFLSIFFSRVINETPGIWRDSNFLDTLIILSSLDQLT